MPPVLRPVLLLAAVGLASGATFHTSSASAGGLGGGGTAFTTSTRINGRPVSGTSFSSGTGQTFSGGGSGLGLRGGFRVPQLPAFRPIIFPRLPQLGTQTSYTGAGIGTRFGGRFGTTTFRRPVGTGFNGIDTDGFFNRLSNEINRSFAANLRG